MSVFERIFASTGDTSISDLLNPSLWLVDWANGAGGRASSAGETVTTDTAMALPAYYACLRVISEDVAKLPLKVYRRMKPRGKDVDAGHPLYSVLHDSPNQQMSSMSFRETLTHWALGWGDGYAEIVKNAVTGKVELLPIHPQRVTIKVSPDGKVTYEVRNEKSQEPTELSSERVFHLHGLGGGVRGYSVLSMAYESVGMGLAAQKFGASFFGNGITLSGFLKTPNTLKPEAMKKLREDWEKNYKGSARAKRMAILEQGMEYQQIGIPPEEAQFLETRQFQVEEICRWFRVPPHKIQHLLRATFSNIEQQSIEYVTDTLQPWLMRWEQEISRKLLAGDPEHFAEHAVNGLLRGDATARGSFYSQLYQIGALSSDDIRELENMNPVPGGDQYFRPANLTPLDPQEEQAGEASPPGEPPDGNPPPGMDHPPEDEMDPAEGRPPREEPGNALYPVFLDAARRVVKTQTAAAARAAEKNRVNPPAFSAWSKTYFDSGKVAEGFAPALEALASLEGAAATSTRWADAYVTRTRESLGTAYATGLMDDWINAEESRAEALAKDALWENCHG